ncbi:glycosyltransferase [Bacteroidales bacterium]|nr:glycosyltransferase [Bacteroidales bacterium]
MKLVSVGPAYPLRGGIANFNESFCLAATKKGIDASIVSYSLQYPSLLYPGKNSIDRNDKPPEGIKISSALNSINPINWIATGFKIRKQNPDILLLHYWMPFFAPALGTVLRIVKMFRRNVKVIGLVHNVNPDEFKLGWRTLSFFFFTECHGFIALSKKVIYDLSEFCDTRKKIVLPHPLYEIFGEKVDQHVAQKELKLSPDFKYLLFFGQIRKYKGLDLLLEAVAKLKLEKIKLIIAGEFANINDRQRYLDKIKHLKIKDKIILFDDFIPQDQVKYFFSASDLVAQTYLSASQSGVTQIAYQFDCPMLVTNVGGLSSMVANNKVGYVAPKDPWKIASLIEDYFEQEKAQSFIENIQKEKHKFSWDSFVDNALAFITESKKSTEIT